MTEKISNIVFDDEKSVDTGENPIELKDVVLVQPTKPVTSDEVVAEMKKQGMRPLTLKELLGFSKAKKPIKIEPKDTDIIIDETKKSKELNG